MCRTFRRTRRLLAVLFVAISLAPALPSTALAQRPGRNDKILEVDTSKSYVLPYALVVLGVALGLMIVARPSTRADSPKRRVDEEDED